MVLLIGLVMTGCRGRWVEDDVAVIAPSCRGGKINTERRVTDTSPITGRIRTTTLRTDACLD
jgi:hypothetical protein